MIKAVYTFIGFLLYQFVSFGLAYLWVNAERLNNTPHTEINTPDSITLGISMLICSLPFIFFLWISHLIRRNPVNSGIRLNIQTWTVSIIGFIVFSLGFSLILSPLQLDDAGQMGVFANMTDNIFCILLLTIIGPLTEELVFREGIMRHFIEKKAHSLLAAAINAALFAVVHGNMAQAVPAFIFGFIFSLYFLRTGDIRLCLVLHIINNSLAIILLKNPQLEQEMSNLPITVQLCIGILGVLIGSFIIWKETFKKEHYKTLHLFEHENR